MSNFWISFDGGGLVTVYIGNMTITGHWTGWMFILSIPIVLIAAIVLLVSIASRRRRPPQS